jgi:hypothetical protein
MSGAMWAWWIQQPMGCPWDGHEMPMGCLVGIRCPRLTCHTLGQPPSLRPRFWLANGPQKVTDYMIDDICNRRMYSYNMSEHDKA